MAVRVRHDGRAARGVLHGADRRQLARPAEGQAPVQAAVPHAGACRCRAESVPSMLWLFTSCWRSRCRTPQVLRSACMGRNEDAPHAPLLRKHGSMHAQGAPLPAAHCLGEPD